MANNFESNIRRKFGPALLKGFHHERNLSKAVDVQLLSNVFSDKQAGENVDFRRPTDHVTVRTADGDVSAETESSIITGKATGTIQPYITSFCSYQEADEAVKMYKKKEITEMPMARRIANDLEVDFAGFMMRNAGLVSGTVGSPFDSWDDVSTAHATMFASGVPQDGEWCMGVNPFTTRKLASGDRSLGVNPEVGRAQSKAIINENYGGMKVISVNTLPTYTAGAGADRAGVTSSAPNATYVTHKDTMIQDIPVSGFQAGLQVKAGEILTAAGVNRLNLGTRTLMVDETGAAVPWRGVVAEDVTLTGGAGTIKVSGPAIFEAGGAYNTVDAAIANGAVVTLAGSASTTYQPNLFWQKQAYSIGSVPIMKLHSTDTIIQTNDGLQLRISYGTDFLKNKQLIRVDLRPAYAALNPFFAGHGYGGN